MKSKKQKTISKKKFNFRKAFNGIALSFVFTAMCLVTNLLNVQYSLVFLFAGIILSIIYEGYGK